MQALSNARITVFAGHYGSGKTSLAVSYAIYMKNKTGGRVMIADLDIVNPYFRTKDSEALLKRHDISLIASEYAGTNLDAPAFPSGAAALFDNREAVGIIDLGGDDRGAYALGRFSERLAAEKNKNILLVINKYRPLSKTPESVAEIKNEIERAARIRFTGIVNNSNLGAYTTAEDVLGSAGYAAETAELTGLPLVMTSVRAGIADALADIPNLFIMGEDINGKSKH